LFSNAAFSTRKLPNTATIWIVALLTACFLIQSASCSGIPPTTSFNALTTAFPAPALDLDQANKQRTSDIDRRASKGWQEIAKELSEYIASKLDKPEVADTVVHEIEQFACEHIVGEVVSGAIGADFVEGCVGIIYTVNGITAPEAEFLSVFFAGLLCNYLVAKIIPDIGKFIDEVCEPCSTHLLDDPENCGECGNKVRILLMLSFSNSPDNIAVPVWCLRKRRMHWESMRWRRVFQLWDHGRGEYLC
jgi:uncharacterized protein (DUF736 family)